MINYFPHLPAWLDFASVNNVIGKYQFIYRPQIGKKMPPVVGIKFDCCNSGFCDQLDNDYDKLDIKTQNIIKDNLVDIAFNHECGKHSHE